MKTNKILWITVIALIFLFLLYMGLTFYLPGWRMRDEAEERTSFSWSEVEAVACEASPPGVRYLVFSDIPGEENPFRPMMETLRLTGPVRVQDGLGGEGYYCITVLLTSGDTVEIRFHSGGFSADEGATAGRLLGDYREGWGSTRVYVGVEVKTSSLQALVKDPALQITCEEYNALSWVRPTSCPEDGDT